MYSWNTRLLPVRTQNWAGYGPDCVCSIHFFCFFILRWVFCLAESSISFFGCCFVTSRTYLEAALGADLNGSNGVSEQNRQMWRYSKGSSLLIEQIRLLSLNDFNVISGQSVLRVKWSRWTRREGWDMVLLAAPEKRLSCYSCCSEQCSGVKRILDPLLRYAHMTLHVFLFWHSVQY